MKRFANFAVCFGIYMLLICLNGCKKGKTPEPTPQGFSVKVSDRSNKAIEHATVNVKAADTNLPGTTDPTGFCSFNSLKIGKYIVSVQAEGYKPQDYQTEVRTGELTPVIAQLEALPMLELSPASIYFTNEKKVETVSFKNRSRDKSMRVTVDIPATDKWLFVDKQSLDIAANTPVNVAFSVDTKGLGYGSLTSRVLLVYSLGGVNESVELIVNLNISNPLAPSVETQTVTGVTKSSAQITGLVVSRGSGQMLYRAICWSESVDPRPDKDPHVIVEGGDPDTFTLTATNLKAGTVYWARAYAKNGIDIGSGKAISFTTSTVTTAPALTLDLPKNVTETSAMLSARVTNDGGASIKQVGFCYNTTGNPKHTENTIQATADGNGNFSAPMPNLTRGVKYFVRAFALNGDLGASDPGYSNEQPVTTIIAVAESKVTTSLPTGILENSALLKGELTVLGGSPIMRHGFCYSTVNALPEASDKNGTIELGALSSDKFEYKLQGLKKGTNYYVRAFVQSADLKIAYGLTKDLVTPENGLLVYYPFNGSTLDASQSGNNASSEAKLTPDEFGNSNRAYYLGSGPIIMLNKQNVGGFINNLTVSFRIKMSEANFVGENKFLLGKFTGCADKFRDGYYFYSNVQDRTLKFHVERETGANDFIVTPASELLDDKWHMITFTKVGKICKFYVDGSLTATGTADFERVRENSFPYDYSLNGATLNIGSLKACNQTGNFDGSIDEFRVYELTMTDFQVNELWRRISK